MKSDYKTSYEFNIPYMIKSIQSIEIIKHIDLKDTVDNKMKAKSINNVTFKFKFNSNMTVEYNPKTDNIPSVAFAIFYIINEHVNHNHNNELRYQMRLLNDFVEWRFTKTKFQFGEDLYLLNLFIKNKSFDSQMSFLEMTVRKYIENYDITNMKVIISENDLTKDWVKEIR